MSRQVPTRSLIVAMSENRVIGREGQLPWHLSSDLRRFKQLTMGHHILMGRKTFESIGRALPGRATVVITRQAGYALRSARVARDVNHALELASDDSEIFVTGGGEIFRQALPMVERIYLTLVHARVDGDTYFPPLDWDEWQLIESQRFSADENNDHDYSFRVYERSGREKDEGRSTKHEDRSGIDQR